MDGAGDEWDRIRDIATLHGRAVSVFWRVWRPTTNLSEQGARISSWCLNDTATLSSIAMDLQTDKGGRGKAGGVDSLLLGSGVFIYK